MTEMILFTIAAFAMICSVPIWLSRHGMKPRAGIKMDKEVLDVSFWVSIISFVVVILSVFSFVN